jgi:hypothetical protein
MSKPLPAVKTILICEGVERPPGDTLEEQMAAYYAAWQELIDTGLAWSLQGWFGREALYLINEGLCSKPEVNDGDPTA